MSLDFNISYAGGFEVADIFLNRSSIGNACHPRQKSLKWLCCNF
jgi:hypothetical protein